LIGVSASGEFSFTAGPLEMPRVAKVPLAAGKADSFAVINGAAKTRFGTAMINVKKIPNTELNTYLLFINYLVKINFQLKNMGPKIRGVRRHKSFYLFSHLLHCPYLLVAALISVKPLLLTKKAGQTAS